MDVRATFVAQREAAEAMQPGQGAFDNPAEDAEAAAMRTAGLGHHRHDALRGQSRGAGARPVGAIALHGAGLTARAPGSAGAMDAENAPTALSSGDGFKNGQKTPCLRNG